MCLPSIKRLPYNPLLLTLVMGALGILSGLSDISFLHDFGRLISDIFIKVFKCISLPIIALSLIVTVSTYGTDKTLNQVWKRTILYTLTTTLFAATVSFFLYLLIQPENITPPEGGLSPLVTTGVNTPVNYLHHILNLIPSTIFSPFLEHQVLGVILVGIVVGIAIRFIDEGGPREALSNFFKGTHGLFLVITKWIVAVIPLGLYGFITETVVDLREGMDLRGLGAYLSIILLANLIQGFIVLPSWLKLNHIKPFMTMRLMLPALSLAFFSKSSAGTLPVTIETAEKNLHINPKISRLVLPLCTSVNMNGCAAFIFTTVLYLMQNNGTSLTFGTMVLWIFISTVAAIGNAGVPMGCFFLSASLLASMDVPIALLGLILPFYTLIDMVETALNVWSDSCVAQVVDQKARENTESLLA